MPYRRQNSRIENARRECVADPASFSPTAVAEVPVSTRPELPELSVVIAYRPLAENPTFATDIEPQRLLRHSGVKGSTDGLLVPGSHTNDIYLLLVISCAGSEKKKVLACRGPGQSKVRRYGRDLDCYAFAWRFHIRIPNSITNHCDWRPGRNDQSPPASADGSIALITSKVISWRSNTTLVTVASVPCSVYLKISCVAIERSATNARSSRSPFLRSMIHGSSVCGVKRDPTSSLDATRLSGSVLDAQNRSSR